MLALLKSISAFVLNINYKHVVIATTAILTISCESNQREILSKTKSLEAQQELKMIHNLEYAHFLQYAEYSSDLDELNYTPHKLVTQGGEAVYKVSIVGASGDGFKARAVAVQDLDNDGQYNVWEINQEGILKEIQHD
jgi:type IV pilus assembly protein PilE